MPIQRIFVIDPGLFHVSLLAVAAVISGGLAGYAWRYRDQPGAVPFSGAMVGVAFWSATDVFALTQTGAGHLFWERVQWAAIAVVPLLFFLFIAAFTGHEFVLSRRLLPLFFVIPVASVVLVWTNPSHLLMWTGPERISTGGVVTLTQSFGPWFWVYFVYAYTLLIIGFVLLLRLVVVSDYLYFDQTVLIVFGILAPLVGNALSVFELAPLPGLDLTPHAFTITGLAFGNAIFRYRLFDLLPATRQLGRQAALSALDDGVVIVGDEQEVLFLNGAAADIFDRDPDEAFGKPLETLLSTDELDFASEDALAELVIADRTYEVTTAPITDQHERLIGHTILLHDVTTRERREQTLRRQRDQLTHLEQINRVIRSVNRALVGATTRDEIARAVCETLASAGPYEAVWFGSGATAGSELVGMTAADEEPRRLDSTEALPDHVTAFSSDVQGSAPVAAEDSRPLERTDGGDWLTVPLVHRRTVYGAIVLQSGRDAGFIERELDILTELGETIGHAIHAVEQRQLLVSDAVVAFELRSTDPDALLVRLSEQVGTCTLDGLVPGEEGGLLIYVTVADATTEEVTAVAADSSGVSDVRPIDENGSATVEISLTRGSLCCPLLEYGANVKSAEAAEGECRVVAEISSESAVRTVVERVTEPYPGTELYSKRELAAGDGETPLPPDAELEALTDRQREVLEAAYRAGYFEWPRDSTAEELADSLDITSATLHGHLRKAEATLVDTFFD